MKATSRSGNWIVPDGPSVSSLALSKGGHASSRNRVVPSNGYKAPLVPVKRKQALGLSMRSLNNHRRQIFPTFIETFGVVTVPVIIVDLVCICWTVWLIILTLEPNGTVNYLMDTETFDDGRFWMLIDQSVKMKTLVVTVFVVVITGYVRVLYKVLHHRPTRYHSWINQLERHVDTWGRGLRTARTIKQVLAFWKELTGFRGRYRKFWVRKQLQSFVKFDHFSCRTNLPFNRTCGSNSPTCSCKHSCSFSY